MPTPLLLLIIGNITGMSLIAATFHFGRTKLKDVGLESSDEIVALFPFPLSKRLKAIVKPSPYYAKRRLCMVGIWAMGILNIIIAAAGVGLI